MDLDNTIINIQNEILNYDEFDQELISCGLY